MISPLTLAHAAYAEPLSAPAITPAQGDDDSLQAAADAGTLMFLLLMKGQQSNNRIAEKNVDASSKIKTEHADQEMNDRIKQLKASESKGLFDSVGGLVSDAFKVFVSGNFDAIGDDIKNAVNSPKFWNDLTKVGAVVAECASTVASVASFGAGSASLVATTALVIGAVLSTAGMVEQNFHVLQTITNDPEFSKYFTIGCMIGSAICGLTGAVVNACTKAAEQVLTVAEQAARAAWTDVKNAAGVIETAGHIASACFQVPSAALTYDLAETNIDAKKHEMQEQMLQSMIDDIVEQLKSDQKTSDKNLESAHQTIAIEQNTQLTAASMLRV